MWREYFPQRDNLDSLLPKEQKRNIVVQRHEVVPLCKHGLKDFAKHVECPVSSDRGRTAGAYLAHRGIVVAKSGRPTIDRHLPGGGLTMGALHEVAGGGDGALDGAAAALFVAGIAARTMGKVLWCVTRQDLFMPGLVQAGLSHNRVLIAECRDETGVLDCFEEGLRCNGLGAVVGEVARLSMTASRRLQLGAEASGVIGLAIRRWRRQAEVSDYGHPTAAATRWRISALPSEQMPVPGIGRARWYLELLRCRAAESADYVVEACGAPLTAMPNAD